MRNKKALGWLGWILIILIVIAVGVGVYLLTTGGEISSITGIGGSSIPQPPALPFG